MLSVVFQHDQTLILYDFTRHQEVSRQKERETHRVERKGTQRMLSGQMRSTVAWYVPRTLRVAHVPYIPPPRSNHRESTMDESTFAKAHIASLAGIPKTFGDDFQPDPENLPKKIPIFEVRLSSFIPRWRYLVVTFDGLGRCATSP